MKRLMLGIIIVLSKLSFSQVEFKFVNTIIVSAEDIREVGFFSVEGDSIFSTKLNDSGVFYMELNKISHLDEVRIAIRTVKFNYTFKISSSKLKPNEKYTIKLFRVGKMCNRKGYNAIVSNLEYAVSTPYYVTREKIER